MMQHNEGNSIVTSMGDVLNGLVIAGLTPRLHSLAGCGTSFLFGITKKKRGRHITCEDIGHAEEFMGRLYKGTPCTELDELRRDCMFTTNRQEEMPLTSDAA